MLPELLSPSRLLRSYQWFCARVGRTFGTWRYLSRITDPIAHLRFYDSKPFAIDLRDPVGIQILLHGFGEAREREEVASSLSEGAVSLDIGGNCGVWARWLIAIGGTEVYSFEPSAATFELLKMNTLDLSSIEAVKMCCGSFTGSTHLSTEAASGLRHISTVGESVEMIRVDDFCASRGVSRVDFMKIDVEGSELDVLAGSAYTIETKRPLILFEYAAATTDRFGYTLQDVTDFLSKFSYAITRIPESNNYLARPV